MAEVELLEKAAGDTGEVLSALLQGRDHLFCTPYMRFVKDLFYTSPSGLEIPPSVPPPLRKIAVICSYYLRI